MNGHAYPQASDAPARRRLVVDLGADGHVRDGGLRLRHHQPPGAALGQIGATRRRASHLPRSGTQASRPPGVSRLEEPPFQAAASEPPGRHVRRVGVGRRGRHGSRQSSYPSVVGSCRLTGFHLCWHSPGDVAYWIRRARLPHPARDAAGRPVDRVHSRGQVPPLCPVRGHSWADESPRSVRVQGPARRTSLRRPRADDAQWRGRGSEYADRGIRLRQQPATHPPL